MLLALCSEAGAVLEDGANCEGSQRLSAWPPQVVEAVAEAAGVWDVPAAPRPHLHPLAYVGLRGVHAGTRFMGCCSLGTGPRK